MLERTINTNDTTRTKLDALMEVTAELAEVRLRHCGQARIEFAMIASEKLRLIPSLIDKTELGAYAKILRLLSIAEAAQIGVLTCHSRIAIPRPDQASPIEGVLQTGEVLGGIHCHRFIPILRDSAGQFTGFGPGQQLPASLARGPIGQILPGNLPSVAERLAAARDLEPMAIPADQLTARPSVSANPKGPGSNEPGQTKESRN